MPQVVPAGVAVSNAMVDTPTPPPVARRAPLRQPPFRRYLLGLTADLVGDQVWFIALAWAATRATDPGTAGVIVAVGTIPRMVALLPAGVIVDRFGALRIAQTAQAVRIVTMLTAVVVALLQPASVPLLMTLAIVFGFADALRLPADGALPPTLLATEELTQGQGLISTVDRVATVIAGPAAGAALAAGGLATAMAVNAALFTGALIAFATLRTHTTVNRRHHPEGTSGVIAGLRYVCRQRHILLILTIVSAINLFLAGPLELGIVLHVEQHGWSAAALVVIFGAFGAAAALGALSLTMYRPRRRPVVAGFACAALSGAAFTSLGYTSTMAASAAAAAVAGVTIAPAGALLLGTVQATTAPEFLGRVMSLVSFASFGLSPIGLVGFGYLAHAIGLPLAFLITGTTVAVLAIAGALLSTTPPPTTPSRAGSST